MLANILWDAAVVGGRVWRCLKTVVSCGSPLGTAPSTVTIGWAGCTMAVFLLILGLTTGCSSIAKTDVAISCRLSMVSWSFSWLGPGYVTLRKSLGLPDTVSKLFFLLLSYLDGVTHPCYIANASSGLSS